MSTRENPDHALTPQDANDLKKYLAKSPPRGYPSTTSAKEREEVVELLDAEVDEDEESAAEVIKSNDNIHVSRTDDEINESVSHIYSVDRKDSKKGKNCFGVNFGNIFKSKRI
eukprot:CAMPEP_0171452394 /NCGR_PEP_ID=MMETSP0945-20130129/520_1 /TAXON_ID=109269 /ORGANISM="Vaucheria litorea, Strain CCMP2940" /LENGTH=112 /DNA_ID=CAMNT_0011977053 /DNA_START=104 /DNA_END=442 /DNA_ORIENTATION=-